MSVSSEVRRTLVKSPPELWAELSDPAALAKHLGELGEIRVVRTEPERIVEWESSEANGRVEIEPSGWGTKVTLTATRLVPEPVAAVAPEPEPEPVVEVELEPVVEVVIDPEPTAQPLPGFFARIFRRRRREQPTPEPEALEPEPEPEPPEPELAHEATETPEAPDLSAELAAAEEVAAEQVTAVLTSVLDRLGAAHHRPFSRA
jgi:hypothetical protein